MKRLLAILTLVLATASIVAGAESNFHGERLLLLLRAKGLLTETEVAEVRAGDGELEEIPVK